MSGEFLDHIYSIAGAHTIADLATYLLKIVLLSRLNFVEIETHIPLVTVHKLLTPLFQRQFLPHLLLCHLLSRQLLFPIHVFYLILVILLHLCFQ